MNLWNNIKRKISYHAVYDQDLPSAIKFAAENGFSGIQIASESSHFRFDSLNSEELQKIGEIANENNVYLTLHGPDDVGSLFVQNNFLQNGILNFYRDFFNRAERLNCRMVTIHLGGMTTFPTDSTPRKLYPNADLEIYQKLLNENLQKLINLVKGRFPICIENYQLQDEILETLSPFLKEKKLFLCWDLPKMYTRSGDKKNDLENYFIEHFSSIRQIHLHDFNVKDTRHSHCVIGSGFIPFKNYFIKFDKMQKAGKNLIEDYCIEVRPKEKALKSLQNLKQILEV